MNFLQSIIHQFVAPEEHALGNLVAAEYAANKKAWQAELEAKGMTLGGVLQGEADNLLAQAAVKAGPMGPVLAALAKPAVDQMVAKAIASVPDFSAALAPKVDELVAKFVAELEAA